MKFIDLEKQANQNKPKSQPLSIRLIKTVDLKTCKICGFSGRVEILMPVFGRTGVRVICAQCQNSTPLLPLNEVFTKRGLYTPFTKRKLIKNLFKAIDIWNKGSEVNAGSKKADLGAARGRDNQVIKKGSYR